MQEPGTVMCSDVQSCTVMHGRVQASTTLYDLARVAQGLYEARLVVERCAMGGSGVAHLWTPLYAPVSALQSVRAVMPHASSHPHAHTIRPAPTLLSTLWYMWLYVVAPMYSLILCVQYDTPMYIRSGLFLRTPNFVWLRTARKDSPEGPPTRQQPTAASRDQPPTTNRHQQPWRSHDHEAESVPANVRFCWR